MILFYASRLASLYYFYFKFNWPWYDQSFDIDMSHKTLTILSRYNIMFKLYVILSVLSYIGAFMGSILHYSYNEELSIIHFWSFRLFSLTPQIVLLLIPSTIFLKYYLYLSQIVVNIDKNDCDIFKVYNEYEKLYTCFKRDYSNQLHLTIVLYLANEVLYIWDSIEYWDNYALNDLLEICWTGQPVLEFIVYVLTGALITECHQNMVNKLWQKGKVYMIDSNQDISDRLCYNYTLQYVQRYPINVKFKFEVTKWNTFRFIIFFVSTKALSIVVKKTLDETL